MRVRAALESVEQHDERGAGAADRRRRASRNPRSRRRACRRARGDSAPRSAAAGTGQIVCACPPGSQAGLRRRTPVRTRRVATRRCRVSQARPRAERRVRGERRVDPERLRVGESPPAADELRVERRRLRGDPAADRAGRDVGGRSAESLARRERGGGVVEAAERVLQRGQRLQVRLRRACAERAARRTRRRSEAASRRCGPRAAPRRAVRERGGARVELAMPAREQRRANASARPPSASVCPAPPAAGAFRTAASRRAGRRASSRRWKRGERRHRARLRRAARRRASGACAQALQAGGGRRVARERARSSGGSVSSTNTSQSRAVPRTPASHVTSVTMRRARRTARAARPAPGTSAAAACRSASGAPTRDRRPRGAPAALAAICCRHSRATARSASAVASRRQREPRAWAGAGQPDRAGAAHAARSRARPCCRSSTASGRSAASASARSNRFGRVAGLELDLDLGDGHAARAAVARARGSRRGRRRAARSCRRERERDRPALEIGREARARPPLLRVAISLRHGVVASRARSSARPGSGHSCSARACRPAPPSASGGPLTVCTQRLPSRRRRSAMPSRPSRQVGRVVVGAGERAPCASGRGAAPRPPDAAAARAWRPGRAPA